MKNYLFVTLVICAFNLSGCGDTGPQGLAGVNGTNGQNGQDGTDGLNGENGVNSTVTTQRFTSDSSVCASGSGIYVKSGLDLDRDGTLALSEVQNSVVLCDGSQGLQGTQGAQGIPGVSSQFAIQTIIDPCGATPGIVNEILLKLASGQIIASFSDNANGNNTRLSLIGPGSYVTTDGSNCAFTIHADGSVN